MEMDFREDFNLKAMTGPARNEKDTDIYDDVSFRERITKSLKRLKIALVLSVAAIILMLIAITGYYVLANHLDNRIGNNERVRNVQSQLQAGRNLTNVSLEVPNTRLAGIESDIIATDKKVQENVDSISQLHSNVSSNSDTLKVLDAANREYENRFNASVKEIESDITAIDTKVEDNADSVSQLDLNVASISDRVNVMENEHLEYENRLNTSVTEIESDIIATDAKVKKNVESMSQLGSNVTAISDTVDVLENTQRRYENRVSDIDSNIIATDTKVQGFADQVSQLGSNISSINSTVQDLITKHREYEIMINTSVTEIESDIIDSNTKLQGNVDQVSKLERNVSSISFSMEEIEKLVQRTEKRLTALESHHNNSFHVLRTKLVTYKGFQFLVLEVRVPASGVSMNDNWCLDYQYLCASFNKRPTGCGQSWTYNHPYSSCRDKYNSDMNIGNVLSCNPTSKIAEIANTAFPDLNRPVVKFKNAFGFHTCKPIDCQQTIRGSDMGLTYMRAFWESSETTFYTVCR